jgi:hypothetical protein
LDDPAGEVGIEFMFVTDVHDGVTYHVPLSYRDAPLAGAEDALVGTSEHGVLGRRWIYDGARDPAVLAALDAFVHGRAEAQDQNRSDTRDRSVTVCGPAGPAGAAVVDPVRVLDGAATAVGRIEAGWSLPDGTTVRGPVALLR